MSQTGSTATNNLQLHHNFRWVLCTNHVEPVRGFLARFLQRRLVAEEVASGMLRSAELARVVDWLPRVWQYVGKFLETHCSADISIGAPQATFKTNVFLPHTDTHVFLPHTDIELGVYLAEEPR